MQIYIQDLFICLCIDSWSLKINLNFKEFLILREILLYGRMSVLTLINLLLL